MQSGLILLLSRRRQCTRSCINEAFSTEWRDSSARVADNTLHQRGTLVVEKREQGFAIFLFGVTHAQKACVPQNAAAHSMHVKDRQALRHLESPVE
jgi:hypothetical protein